jgi:transcriptional regulator with XRE-family HTH domain
VEITDETPRAKRDPKHRAKRTGDGPVLTGEALQREICRLREEDESLSLAEIARRVGCSRAYASRVCSAVVEEADERLPAPVLEAMLAHLRVGEKGDLLDLPGVADAFPVRDLTAPPDVQRQRQRDALARWINYGRDAAEGTQKRALYLAKQDGKAKPEA